MPPTTATIAQTTTTALEMTTAPGPHHVVVLALPGVVLLDLAAPVHLFGHCGAGRYTLEVAGMEPGPVVSSTGLAIHAERGLEALRDADTVVVPGFEGAASEAMRGSSASEGRLGAAVEAVRGSSASEGRLGAAVEAVRGAHGRGSRVMSVCTGAFVLGAAGLLDGIRATTHWWACAALAEQHPRTEVDPDVLYVDAGQVLTSAGVASGLDLCLHVIRRDHGADVAAEFARRTVVAPHRDGGQAQFVQRPVGGRPDTGAAEPAGRAAGLEATRAWALERLEGPLDVATLAAHACVSPRTFARRFREETGTTPARWVTGQRVAEAQRLLERTDLPVETIAVRAGFGTAASLRQHLSRHARTTPTAYRRAFRTSTT